ncbi:hypothetical protein [Haladaptatus halobius]|nr:hypothetical protein [Haladaptatus halobius]
MNREMTEAIERIERAGVPPWHSFSVESARGIEDEAPSPRN